MAGVSDEPDENNNQVFMAVVQMMVHFSVFAPFICCDVSEKHTAFVFRVIELIQVDAEVITSGAQFVKLLILQLCPAPF
jgi:hypothetical protein